MKIFSAVIFFLQFSVIKTLDSELDLDPQLGKMLEPDSDPHLNQCVFTTMPRRDLPISIS